MAKDKIVLDLEVNGLSDIQSANTELSKLEQTAEELKKQLSSMDEGTDSFKQVNKQLQDTTKQINLLKDAAGDLDLDAKFDDIYEAGAPLSGRLGELEDRMYELALAGLQNTEGFKQLQEEAVNIRQTIIRVDESIDDLAANKGLASFGQQLRGVGESLLTLDFDRAAVQAQSLANSAKNISFDNAAKSVKNLGSTFINLGKALLANPLFLLAAAIVAIVLVVKELMDEIGLTKVIMEQFGKVLDVLMIPIKALIQGLKDLTDWLGWTSNAAEDAAEKKATSLESAAERGKVATDTLVAALDHEIRMMELNGESAVELKKKRLQALAEQAEAEARAANARLQSAKLSGELDAAEMKALQDKVDATKAAYRAALNEIEYFNAESEKLRQEAEKKEKEEQDKKNKEAADKAREAREKRLAAEKEYNENRLSAERLIEDLRIENIENDTERELEANRVKYERLIADTISNQDLLETEKQKIIDQYREAQKTKDEEIRQAEAEEQAEKAKEEAEKEAERLEQRQEFLTGKEAEYKLLDAERRNAEYEVERLNEQARFEAELATFQEALNNKLITEEEYARLRQEAIENNEANITDITARENKARLDEQRRIEEMKVGAVFNGLQSVANLITLFAGKNKKAAKAAFNLNKGIQIAQATVDTYKSAVTAYASQLIPGDPTSPIRGGFAAAAAVTTGLLNIAKIASAKFDEGGGGSVPSGGAASVNIPPAPAQTPPPAPTPPDLQLTNQEQAGSEGGEEQAAGVRQVTEVRAIVVESDITSTQNRLSTYQERSEIG